MPVLGFVIPDLPEDPAQEGKGAHVPIQEGFQLRCLLWRFSANAEPTPRLFPPDSRCSRLMGDTARVPQ